MASPFANVASIAYWESQHMRDHVYSTLSLALQLVKTRSCSYTCPSASVVPVSLKKSVVMTPTRTISQSLSLDLDAHLSKVRFRLD